MCGHSPLGMLELEDVWFSYEDYVMVFEGFEDAVCVRV